MKRYRIKGHTGCSGGKYYKAQVQRIFWPFWMTIDDFNIDIKDARRAIERHKMPKPKHDRVHEQGEWE